MKTNFLFLFISIFILSNCNRMDIDPSLPTCTLTSTIVSDSLKMEFTYSANKLTKETLYGYRSNQLLSYSEYKYNVGEVIKNSYSANGTIFRTEKYQLNLNNDIILKTGIQYGDNLNQREIFDTAQYSYDANNYLSTIDSDTWYIYTDPTYNKYNHNESFCSYSYPSSNVIIITQNDISGTTIRTNEYYDSFDYNPNSFQYLPYTIGKTNHKLLKNENFSGTNFSYQYKLDHNKNIIEQRTSNKDQVDIIEKFYYDCSI
jgi:hypothetical protein